MTEDEMVGWHHRLNGHEFEQAQGDGEGQASLVCCSPGGRKESGTAEQLTKKTTNTHTKELGGLNSILHGKAGVRARGALWEWVWSSPIS